MVNFFGILDYIITCIFVLLQTADFMFLMLIKCMFPLKLREVF